MERKRPRPPRPDRLRLIEGSFSWIDHRFLRQGFDRGLERLEKLFYFVLIALSNRDGVSFYSEERLSQILQVRYPDELRGARQQLVAQDLIAFESGIYQVLRLSAKPPPPGHYQLPSTTHKRVDQIPAPTRQACAASHPVSRSPRGNGKLSGNSWASTRLSPAMNENRTLDLQTLD